MNNKKLILFDIDGTILHFRQNLSRELFAEFLTELFGREIPDKAIPPFSGMTDLLILKEISNYLELPHETMLEKLPQIWLKMKDKFSSHSTKENITILPGVVELINMFDENEETELGLVTGNFVENAYIKLNAYNLGKYFKTGAFGNDNENRNDLPPIAISRANEFYGIDIFDNANTVIIGDTFRDIECAKVNNIRVVAVATGGICSNELIQQNPDLCFENFQNYKNCYNQIMEIF